MRTRQPRPRCHDQCIPVATALLLATTVPTIATAEPPARREVRVTEEIRRLVEAPADAAVDARIDESRITDLPAAKAPATVLLPAEPVHRIATSREETGLDGRSWESANRALLDGLAWLAAAQSDRGAWMEGERVEATDRPPREAAASVAVTALALKGFAQAAPSQPELVRARDQALGFIRGRLDAEGFDGLARGGLGNYVTSAITMGLVAVGSDTQDELVLAEAVDRLTSNQWDQSEGVGPSRDWFGGAGYGRHGRPDLSNTQMMLDALYDAGVCPDEPSVQRALVFLSRTQNLKETNPADWAQAGSNDGGFVYSPANGGESMASEVAGEGRHGEIMPSGAARSLRSYGSMTYAGFKSLLFAGLDAEDPRVEAALGWIRRHWTFDENPGMGQQGLYYYLHAMARALRASGLDVITTPDGEEHDWRAELIEAIVSRQAADGSWANPVERWEESRPSLATTYAVLALGEALKPTPRSR
ncbi:MAG: prenyltransferase/squalene oxidase repeat-containing protein [Planctomycetota bacterium]|nr:prenyltransferase/squalene oxidase repeat-containing protein [Planctomycetota bacterium]